MSPTGDAFSRDAEATALHSRAAGAPDLLDRIAEEFAERCRRGESPTVAEYESRYPEHAGAIRGFLPTVALMEQLKRGAEAARGTGASPAVPERLGEFRLLRELGRGGMGIVYEADQESLGRRVALKVLRDVHLDRLRLERFRREALAVARLHHTNIVPIFGFGEQDGLPYYVMQYIQGKGLDALLADWRIERDREGSDRRRDPWRVVATVGEQAARALQYAHDQGILHRDIKPANLLLDEHQGVWVTDFGLAKLIGEDDLTRTGDVIGTLRYLAPESLRGATDARSDIYSLGLTLYELLTLTPPFGELTPSELLRHVGEGEPLRPRLLDAAIPRDLETIVLKATAREPGHRYPTADALADDLRRYLEDRPILARRITPPERVWRWARRNPTTAAMVATALVSLAIAAVTGFVANERTTRALKRESQNVALSLEAFADIFDKLAPGDNLLPPPPSRSGRSRPGPMGPPPDGFGGGDGPPGAGGPRPGSDPFVPTSSRLAQAAEGDTALLRSVLGFYDRFARQNATNPRLQGEAAWAYRRVGALYSRIGRQADADAAFDQAARIFESLIAQYPRDARARHRLVETYIMADPWSAAPSGLGLLRVRLTRARSLVDRLVSESPEDPEYLQSQIHVHAKLGAVQQRLDQLDDAEGSYRRAIEVCDALIARSERPIRPQIDRAMIRETLAELQIERGRPDQARDTLDRSADELAALATSAMPDFLVVDRYQTLGDLYRRLDEPIRAAQVDQRAAEIRARMTRNHHGPGRLPRGGF